MTDLLTPSPDPQPGDLYLTRSEGFVGTMIRFGERVEHHGWWGALSLAARSIGGHLIGHGIPEDPTDPSWGNHIAVVMDDGTLTEALAAGLTVSPGDKYRPGTYRVLHLICSDEERATAMRFAHRELAKPHKYAWLSILSVIVQLTTPSRLDITIDGTMICSCWGARVWEHAGKTIPTLSPYTTMPSALAYFAQALPAIPQGA